MNPKYDPNNYLKYTDTIYLIGQFQKLTKKFGSSLLMIKWARMGVNKLPNTPTDLNNLQGIIRLRITTPLGELEPQDYNLKVSPLQGKPYIQFLTIPNPDFQYSLEIQNPVGIDKTTIEIWEYTPPTTYQKNTMSVYNQPSKVDLTTVVDAVAEGPKSDKHEPPTISRTEVIMDNQKFYQCVAANSKNKAIILTAMTDAEVRIWLTSGEAPAFDTTVFSSDDWFDTPGYSYEMTGINSVVEIPEEFAMFAIWAISKQKVGVVDMGELSVIITTEGALVPPAPLRVEVSTPPINVPNSAAPAPAAPAPAAPAPAAPAPAAPAPADPAPAAPAPAAPAPAAPAPAAPAA